MPAPPSPHHYQACLADPAAASNLLVSGPNVAPCLLSSLEQGFDEAAQLLLLVLLTHGSSSAPTPAWPPAVTTRLAALVARSGSSQQQPEGRANNRTVAGVRAASEAPKSTAHLALRQLPPSKRCVLPHSQ
jgi:hypothetical protein